MNNLIEYPVPDWIKTLFLLTIPIPVIMTILLAGTPFKLQQKKSVLRACAGFFLLYIVYVFTLGYMDCFKPVFFPPRVLLFTTFPFAFFLFLFLIKTKYYQQFVNTIRLDQLVQVHVFRLIGVFFLLLAFHKALPPWFATVAGVGDMITALTSLWIAGAIRSKKPLALKLTWIWNTFGLIDILFTAISANVLTKLSIDKGIMGVDSLAMFPFYLIPALAPPIIVVLHYTLYLKLSGKTFKVS